MLNLRGLFTKNHRIHLDYASTTPVHPKVYEAMRPYWGEVWANPSAIYKEGVVAREAIERARTELAQVLHVRSEGITFTSGGTESNNLAIIGTIELERENGRAYDDMEIVSTKIEHPSILETLAHLSKLGVHVVYAQVDEEGIFSPKVLEPLLSEKTVLVTLAYVNSEIGVVQDVKGITRAVRKWNDEHGKRVLVHLDASQTPLWLDCTLDMLGVDLMTLDAGKCYGPKGIGVLARRHGVKLSPILYGGGQEGGLRSGTENTALIVGCVRAIVRAQGAWESRSGMVSTLRDELFSLIAREIPEAVVNGSRESRVANNVNISIPGLDSEYAVIWLDEHGIACATRSACGVKGKDGSSVVKDMTGDDARARSTIRFTLGEETTKDDLEKAVRILREHVDLMQKR